MQETNSEKVAYTLQKRIMIRLLLLFCILVSFTACHPHTKPQQPATAENDLIPSTHVGPILASTGIVGFGVQETGTGFYLRFFHLTGRPDPYWRCCHHERDHRYS